MTDRQRAYPFHALKVRTAHAHPMTTLARHTPHPSVGRSCRRIVQARLLKMCLLLWMFVPVPALSAPFNVSVVISDDSAPYVEIADYLASELNRQGLGRSRTISLVALAHLDRTGTDAVVAVGLKATQAVAAMKLRVPVISTLIPRVSFEKVARDYYYKDKQGLSSFSAVYLNQPVKRQLELIRVALPHEKRIGVILGPESEDLFESLRAETRARGMRLYAARINSEAELFPALEDVLSKADVLLSLPDSLVFNAQTIQSVLFTSYRSRVPVIGFSPAYVRAGALVAVHSTPVQLARQVTEMLSQLVSSATLPPSQYPKYFSVTANHRVARSLELMLEKEDELATRLGAREITP